MNTKPKAESPSVTYITESTHVNADINCKDDIRISGTVDGNIKTSKKIILSKEGKIKGKLTSPTADIAGNVDGDIITSGKLTLRPTAVVTGKIQAEKLSIEDGAQLTGEFMVGPGSNASVSKPSSTVSK
ncbi:bactofilin family protein [Gracilimonas halophila]|uniref:Polymer-forming cytoskeletal protein n=1 Tax=Gracilimonas halophila TaxID=1834464 RepID=A0ABW5JHD0_9BACT